MYKKNVIDVIMIDSKDNVADDILTKPLCRESFTNFKKLLNDPL